MQIDGTWVNQNGSTVEFEADVSGRLSGYYCSRKGLLPQASATL